MIAPLCVVLLVAMWISWGLEGALVFFGVALFVWVATALIAKWIEFVDKHIKD